MDTETKQPILPYIPYKTFKTFIHYLHQTVLPEQIDNTMMPQNFSGSARAGVISALKSLGLIDAQNNTSQKLKDLVTAFDTEGWPAKVKECVLSAYESITQNIVLESATRGQIEQIFEDASAQMKDKCIRFFLMANKEAGIKYSPYLSIRRRLPKKRIEKTTPKHKTTAKDENELAKKSTNEKQTPADMYDLQIPNTPGSFIRVPNNITTEQVVLVKAAVTFLEIMAKQNEESK
jgi:hypothetical protein